MWISRALLLLCLAAGLVTGASIAEERVIIVEPQRPNDDLVSIVEAQPLHAEPLVTVVEAIPEPALENPSVEDKSEDDALVTIVEEDHRRQPLPDTSAITGELIEKLGVTNFFALWLVFNDPSEIELQTGTEFSILAPQQTSPVESLESDPNLVRKILLDHVILGRRLHLGSNTDFEPFEVTSLGGRQIHFTYREGSWHANGAKVLYPESEISVSGELVVVDNYIFSDYVNNNNNNKEKKAPETEEEDQQPNEPTTEAAMMPANLADELTKLPALFNLTRIPVFNMFLKEANVSGMLKPGEQYTVLFPMDRAFHRWHPIDWGFYPFSVPEFTADIIRSHFLKGAIRFDDITDNQTATTITNRTITFHKTAAGDVTANGVLVMRRNVALRGGTVLVVPEVLFVDNKIVQQLRERNRDKETPPLLAYPWWNAQFLSHSYLALETNPNFTSVQRLMNAVPNLHLQVPGKNYSFLVPTDEAFERAHVTVPEWWSERDAGDLLPADVVTVVERFVLRHIVPGRLYMRDLKANMVLHSLDNSTHTVTRLENDMLAVDGTSIIERGDVFVYNLGTMFYVDGALGSDTDLDELRKAVALVRPKPATSELREDEDEADASATDLLLEEESNSSSTGPHVTTSKTSETVSIATSTVAPATSTAAPEIKPADNVNESRNTESNDIPAAAVIAPEDAV